MDKHILLKHLKTILEPILHLISKCVKSVNGVYPDKDGNVELEIDSGLPSVSAPHQMLVTDADGKTVWEERTHYKRTKKEVIFEEQDLTLQFVETQNMYSFRSEGFLDLVLGETYAVTWDGKTYMCTAFDMSDQYSTVIVLGGDLGTGQFESNGEPFLIASIVVSGNVMYNVQTLDGEQHTLKIEKLSEATETLDESFIPDTIARGVTLIIKTDGYDNALAGMATASAPMESATCLNMTFDKAMSYACSGMPMTAIVMEYGRSAYPRCWPACVLIDAATPSLQFVHGDAVVGTWTADGITV